MSPPALSTKRRRGSHNEPIGVSIFFMDLLDVKAHTVNESVHVRKHYKLRKLIETYHIGPGPKLRTLSSNLVFESYFLSVIRVS